MLWLHIDLPRLPLEVFPPLSKRDFPRIVVSGSTRQAQVVFCSTAALAMGIRPGMRLADAWLCARQPLSILWRDEQSERMACEGLALWARQFSAIVSIVPPQGIVLEVEQSFGLFGGMQALCQRIRRDLDNIAYSARIGMAPTPLGAELLAQADITQPAMNRDALKISLSSLPVDCLEDGSGFVEMLRKLGIQRIGECFGLPRQAVSQRLGPTLWHVLDRVLGAAPDPRPVFEPSPRFRRCLALPAPVTRIQALHFAMQRLLMELAGFLRTHQQGVEQLVLELAGARGEVQRLTVGFVSATRDPDRLTQALTTRLENCLLCHPVENVALAVQAMRSLRGSHLSLLKHSPPAEQEKAAWFLDQFNARLGRQRVNGLCLQSDHRPEYAWHYCRPGSLSKSISLPGRRPLWLLEKPVPLAGDEELFLMWGKRKLHFEQGPERIESGWWDGRGIARDYYVATESGGVVLWIFCERRGKRRWYVHGFFA